VTVYVLLNSHVVCLLLISVFRYNCLYQFFEAHFEGHVTDFDKCQLTFTLSRCCKLKNLIIIVTCRVFNFYNCLTLIYKIVNFWTGF